MDLIPHAGRIAGELDINHWNSSLCERKDAFFLRWSLESWLDFLEGGEKSLILEYLATST